MDPTAAGYLSSLLGGLGVALWLTAAGFVGASALGVLAAACRVGPIAPLRVCGTLYVELFRNIPLLCLLILLVFGLPDVGVLLPLPAAVIVALALVNGAYICEAVRSGINAVPVGHIEAARVLGFGLVGVLRFVVLPLALRTTVQPLVNAFISTLLGSALASAVGVTDLIGAAQTINLHEAWGVGLFAAAAAVYAGIALGVGAIGGVIERRVAVRQ